MVIIGGEADGNEGDVFFSFFSAYLSCFQLIHVCLCPFFMFFGCLIRVLEVSPFVAGQSVLLIASHAQNIVLSRERKLR